MVQFLVLHRKEPAVAYESVCELGSKDVSNICLAKTKGEALDNIYSLLEQNIKSCFAKRRRQRER